MDILKLFHSIEFYLDPDKVFLVAEESLSYKTLFQRIHLMASFFKTNQIGKNDRILIATKNPTAFATFFLSLLRNGITAVIVDPENSKETIEELIRFTNAKGVILDEEKQKVWQLSSVLIEIKSKIFQKKTLFNKLLGEKKENGYPHLFDRLHSSELPPQIDLNEDAYILFTSGTTSQPKGVRISYRSLFSHLMTISKELEHTSESRLLCLLPLHHGDGLVHGLMSTFYNQATLYRPFLFSIQQLETISECIKNDQITHWITVPTILNLMDKLEVPSFKTSHFLYVVSVAAALEKNLWIRFETKYDVSIINTYGLTETVASGLFCNSKLYPDKIGALGKPVDCQAQVIDAHGILVPCGEVGELILKGENIMKGYFQMQEMTDSALNEGWLHTGDLVKGDEDGFYHLVGRKKTVIIRNGFNIYPEEIVDCLLKCREVVEVGVFGQEDPMSGELPVACVVLLPKSKIDAQFLFEHCRRLLPTEKQPRKIFLMKKLPKSEIGKVQIEVLKKQIAQPQRETSSEILEIAAKVFGTTIEDVSLEKGPSALPGWDSMGHMQFVTSLEQTFKIRLSPKEILKMDSLLSAKKIIDEHLSAL